MPVSEFVYFLAYGKVNYKVLLVCEIVYKKKLSAYTNTKLRESIGWILVCSPSYCEIPFSKLKNQWERANS
jgi:hypothetical protein